MHKTEAGIYIAVIAGVMVLISLVAYFVVIIVRYQQKLVKLHVEKLRAHFDYLDKERQRIARDMHDELGASVSNVKLHLQCLEGLDEENKNMVSKCEDFLDHVMQQIRSIAYNLMPLTLERKGLNVALEELIGNIKRTTQIAIYFNSDVEIPDKVTANHIYRISHEILNNSVQHSGASNVSFKLSKIDKIIKIRIVDNGFGFNKDSISLKSSGLGLHSITSRVRLMSGKIYLSTEPHKGVDYNIEIPST